LNHWAYDAVSKLAADGIVIGYPDGTFQGTKPITRYEMAMVVARALAKVDETKASKEDLALLKKLVVEFQDELNALGVKVDGIDKRLAVVEKNLNGFAFSGQLRVEFRWNNGDLYEATGNYQDATVVRARVWMKKQVDDNVSVALRLKMGGNSAGTNVSSDFAYMDIKFPWDIKLRVGRFFWDWEDPVGLYYDHDAIISDRFYGPGALFTKNIGNADVAAYYAYFDGDELSEYGTRLNFYFNDKLRVGLFYIGLVTETNSTLPFDTYAFYGGDFTVNFTKGFKVYAQYIYEDLDDGVVIDGELVDDAAIYKVGLAVDQSVIGFTSFVAEYFHADKGAVVISKPYGGGGQDYPCVGYFAQDFLIRDTGTLGSFAGGFQGNLVDDLDLLFIKLEQKWSDKVSTIERYYGIDYSSDAYPDATAFSLALRYQYTPSTTIEFSYTQADWDESAVRQDESHFRVRTMVNF